MAGLKVRAKTIKVGDVIEGNFRNHEVTLTEEFEWFKGGKIVPHIRIYAAPLYDGVPDHSYEKQISVVASAMIERLS